MRLILLCLVSVMLPVLVCSDPFNLHGLKGFISSDHFPDYYENNLNNTWTITVNEGYKVVLYFTFFDLEDSFDDDQCSQDYVEIFDGDTTSKRTSGRLCGNPVLYPDDAPSLYSEEFYTTGNVMTLRFVTDYSNDLPDSPAPKGFQAIYKAEDIDECERLEQEYEISDEPEKVGKCDHYCHNFLGGYTCTCKQGYALAKNGYFCKGQCSNRYITASSGYISSPGFPEGYPKSTQCDWTIEADVGQVIELNFNETYSIESHPSGICPYDWLEIGEGTANAHKYCGTRAPAQPIVTTGNVVKISFNSDNVTEMAGFQILYRSRGVFCPVPETPQHGRVVETYGVINGQLPFDAVIVFECEIGYEMRGVHKITCLKDGTFDDNVPTCEGK